MGQKELAMWPFVAGTLFGRVLGKQPLWAFPNETTHLSEKLNSAQGNEIRVHVNSPVVVQHGVTDHVRLCGRVGQAKILIWKIWYVHAHVKVVDENWLVAESSCVAADLHGIPQIHDNVKVS